MRYCQHNEEEIIDKYIKKDKGIYVDVGAGSPCDLSNTYHLYLRGWKGLTVEPILGYSEDHRRLRPTDSHFHGAISNYDGEIEICDTAVLGSFLGDEYATRGTLTGVKHPIRKEQCLTMNSLIARYPDFAHPDFFSLDVETNEDKVLEVCDFTKFTPTLMIIENVVRYKDYRENWINYIDPYYNLVETLVGNLAFLRK